MKIALICAAAAFWGDATFALARDPAFILGVDISWVPEDEASRVQYFDRGVREDILGILKEYDFNCVRLRIFVNPRNGYSRNGGVCDSEHTQALEVTTFNVLKRSRRSLPAST
jgi:arabinogalactan endo-1,4-beta-galactosidase